MRMQMPAQGRSREDVLAELRSMKQGDVDWRGGRAPLYVFKGSDEGDAIGREAFFEFFTENGLGGARAFQSVKRMEDEVLAMALSLFHAPDSAEGFYTTGGTESLVQAVLTCRDHARAQRGDPAFRGNIVAPETTHPGFDKGARLMDLEVRRVPVRADLRADVPAMADAIDDQTLMLVGSAPCFPYGVIDPIAELGELAQRRGLWLHVDACVGGYLAPFVRMAGRPVPDFDFSVPGVSSLSADLHKYGFCPKPGSTLFYRDRALSRHHRFDFDVWPSGRFVTGTLTGTRPAGGAAGAWAVFQHLGVEGYVRTADTLMQAIDRYRAGVAAIPGLKVLGDPDLAIVAVIAEGFDIFQVAEGLQTRGWLPGLLQRPRALHRMMSMLHARSMEAYLSDLSDVTRQVRQAAAPAPSTLQASYGG